MPSQVILYDIPTLSILAAVPDMRRRLAVGKHGLEIIPGAAPDGLPLFRVHVAPRDFCEESVAPFLDSHFVLLLTADPLHPGLSLPRPLEAAVVIQLLDLLRDGLADLAQTAHDILDFCAPIEVARAAGPLTRPRSRRHDSLPGHLAAEVTVLSKVLAPDLQRLDAKLAGYRARMAPTGLDTAIIRLGLQSELGRALTFTPTAGRFAVDLDPACGHAGPLPEVLRRGGNLLLTCQALLTASDDAEIEGRNWISAPRIAALHRLLGADLPGCDAVGAWARFCDFPQQPFQAERIDPVAAETAIQLPMAAFAETFDRDAWRDVHPLLRAGLALPAFGQMQSEGARRGPLGRLILAAMLHEDGIPCLPLHYVLDWNRDRYEEALLRVTAVGDRAGFLRFLIEVLMRAVDLADVWLEQLKPARAALLEAFLAGVSSPLFCDYAATHAVSMVLGPDPQYSYKGTLAVHLNSMFEEVALLDRVQLPEALQAQGFDLYAVYSAPLARRLAGMPALI